MAEPASELKSNPNTTAKVRLRLGMILLFALSARVMYMSQMLKGPCIDQHRWPQSDMHFFDQWAGIIADGDCLTDRALHPHHQWHKDVAAQAGASSPEIWDQWYGGKRFHQEPGYPYLIALTYRVVGRDVRWVFAWQMACGLASMVLLFRITRRVFGDSAGLIAAGMAAMYGPLMFYEMVLLRTTLITMVGLALVDLTQVALDRGGRQRWFVMGAAAGIAVLIKMVFALYAAGLLLMLLSRHRREVLPWVAGFALALLPLVARNVAVGAPTFGISSVGAVTFVCTNGPGYEPGSGFLGHQPDIAQIMAKTNGQFFPAAINTLSLHPNIGSYLNQLCGKVRATLGWHEIPNNVNFYFYQLHAPILRYLPIGFCVLAPLGLAGVVLSLRRVAARPLLLLVIVSIAPLLIFYVLSRFRVAMAIALLPFAAAAMVQWIRWWRSRQWRPAMLMLLLTSAMIGWIATRGPSPQRLVRPSDYGATWIAHYRPQAQEAIRQNDMDAAVAIMEKLLRFQPNIITRPDADFAKTYHEFYLTYAMVLQHAGRLKEAQAARRIADYLNAATHERTER